MMPPNLRIGLQDWLALFTHAGGSPAHGLGPSNSVLRPSLAVASPPLIAQCPSGVAADAESPLIMAVTNGKVWLSASRRDGAGHERLPWWCRKPWQYHVLARDLHDRDESETAQTHDEEALLQIAPDPGSGADAMVRAVHCPSRVVGDADRLHRAVPRVPEEALSVAIYGPRARAAALSA